MTRWYTKGIGAMALSLALTFFAVAGDIEKNIQDLKHQDPEVRAKAAYDLGCG